MYRRRYVFVSDDHRLHNALGKEFAKARVPMLSVRQVAESKMRYHRFVDKITEPAKFFAPLLVMPNACTKDYEELKKINEMMRFTFVRLDNPDLGLGMLLFCETNNGRSLGYATSFRHIVKQVLSHNLGEK